MDAILSYLKQTSTWRGLVSIAVAAGLIHISAEAQDAVVALALQVVAVGESLKGTINVLRNEKAKKK